MTNYVKSYKINQDGTVSAETITPYAVPTSEVITDTEVEIAVLGVNKAYNCVNPIASLEIGAFEETPYSAETVLYFTTDADFTAADLTMPANTQWSPFKPVIRANTSYVMCVQNNVVILGSTESEE